MKGVIPGVLVHSSLVEGVVTPGVLVQGSLMKRAVEEGLHPSVPLRKGMVTGVGYGLGLLQMLTFQNILTQMHNHLDYHQDAHNNLHQTYYNHGSLVEILD